jgi:hypothetical protein
MHQETHDVIRQWQEIKRERHVQSQWLFPSGRYSRADKTYGGQYLQVRVRELIVLVKSSAPYSAPVEGPEGNLVHFDLSTIDPYSFRHAFAQRLADATDQEGRSSTPPDIVQDFMGHQNFNTTMAYYQVTAKRRKKALSAIPARRLNLHGQVTEADRERDGFGKIAVALGHCTEPQNVAASGHFCALEHSCESCPFFLVIRLSVTEWTPRDTICGSVRARTGNPVSAAHPRPLPGSHQGLHVNHRRHRRLHRRAQGHGAGRHQARPRQHGRHPSQGDCPAKHRSP